MSQNASTKKVVKEVKTATSLVVEKNEIPTETPKNEETTTPVLEKQKAELNAIFNPSAETKLKKAEQLRIIGDKYNFLKQKEDDLNNYVLSSDGTNEKIELTNKSGFKFVVTNTRTIEQVIEFLQKDLGEFILKAEKEIQEFVI